MQRSSLPVGVSTLKKWQEMGNLNCRLEYQRHMGMWDLMRKSRLIKRMLMDSYIPAIVLLKDKTGEDSRGKEKFSYSVLDGLQRLSNVFEFISDGWRLHGSLEPVEIDGEEHEIAGKLFSELAPELQDLVRNFRFSVQNIENYTSPEAEELFFDLNSGIALSKIQMAKAKLGRDLAAFFNRLLEGSFFSQSVNLTENQCLKEDDLLMLLVIAMLMDHVYEGREYKNISQAALLSYAAGIRDNYGRDRQERLSGLMGYLDEAFCDGRVKFLKKNNIPIVGMIAHIAQKEGLPPYAFKSFIDSFSNRVIEEYEAASGSGNIKAAKVQQRLSVMYGAFLDYFGLDPQKTDKPFYTEEGSGEQEESGEPAGGISETGNDGTGEAVGV